MSIEKKIRDLGKAFSKSLLDKQEKDDKREKFNQISSADLLEMLLKSLVHKGEYNKAEDLLFDELSKNNCCEVYELGVEFYNSLLEKSDEELNDGNFSREEIYQGLEDIKKINSKTII